MNLNFHIKLCLSNFSILDKKTKPFIEYGVTIVKTIGSDMELLEKRPNKTWMLKQKLRSKL